MSGTWAGASQECQRSPRTRPPRPADPGNLVCVRSSVAAHTWQWQGRSLYTHSGVHMHLVQYHFAQNPACVPAVGLLGRWKS